MDDEHKPWNRQPGEPAMWFHRFDTYYRPLGPERTLQAAYDTWRRQERTETNSGARQGATKAWRSRSTEWHWQERAEAWDAEERRKRIAVEETERAEMLRRHVQIARGLQSIGLKRLRQLDATPEELSPAEARQYLKESIEIERKARGLPTFLLELMAMTDEQLLAYYAQLLAQSGEGGGSDADPGTGPAVAAGDVGE